MLSAFVKGQNKKYSAERVPLFKFNIKIILFELILKLVQRDVFRETNLDIKSIL